MIFFDVSKDKPLFVNTLNSIYWKFDEKRSRSEFPLNKSSLRYEQRTLIWSQHRNKTYLNHKTKGIQFIYRISKDKVPFTALKRTFYRIDSNLEQL